MGVLVNATAPGLGASVTARPESAESAVRG